MIQNILPLTKIRLDILSELYVEPLQGKDIASKIGRKVQVTHNTLSDMKEILTKEKGLYSINQEYILFLKKILLRHLLERRLGIYFASLQYIKKYCEVEEMILFGSSFRGDYDSNSDIDIYIISKDTSISKLGQRLSKIYKKEFQLICVHPQEHLTKNDTFSDLYKSISTNRSKGIKVDLDIL